MNNIDKNRNRIESRKDKFLRKLQVRQRRNESQHEQDLDIEIEATADLQTHSLYIKCDGNNKR